MVCEFVSDRHLYQHFCPARERLGEAAAAGMGKTDFAKKRIMQLQQTANTFRELARPPLPANLSPDEKQHTPRVNEQQMQAMNQSFNLQYLALQENMQNERRRFSLLSNIMRTKHDTAKNSISNLR